SAERGLTYMPGKYPEQYLRWGYNLDGNPSSCPITNFTCTAGGLTRFQLLNDPDLTVLGHGQRTAMTLGVSGGSATLQYALTGSASEELGFLKLSNVAAQSFEATHGS